MPETGDEHLSFDELLTGIRAGDEVASKAFWRRYEPRFRLVLRVSRVIRRLQPRIGSDDLAQSVFIDVFAAIRDRKAEFPHESALEAYLLQAGWNRLRDHLRRENTAKRGGGRTFADPEVLAQVATNDPTPSKIAEVREEVARVEDCVTASELLLLRERADGVCWREIAGQRNTSDDAARLRVARIRRRLRENWDG